MSIISTGDIWIISYTVESIVERRNLNIFGTLAVVLGIGLFEFLNLDVSLKIFLSAVASGYFVNKYRGRSGGYGALAGGLIGLFLLGGIHIYEQRTGRAAEAQALRKSIAEVNSTLPQMINDDLRMDRISVTENEIQYFGTYVDRTIDQIDVEAAQAVYERKVAALSCEGPDSELALAEHLDYRAYFFDMDGVPVFDFRFSKADCR